MKKIVSLLIVVVICILTLISCASGVEVGNKITTRSEHFKITNSMMAYYANTYVNNWINTNYIYVLYGTFDPSRPCSEQLVPNEENITFYDYFVSGTKNMVTQYLNYCEAAMVDPDFDYETAESDAEAYAKKTIDTLKSNAKAVSMSPDEYLRNQLDWWGLNFGKYVGIDDMEKAIVIEHLASSYYDFIVDKYESLANEAREDRYFKEHFEEFIFAEYIEYTVQSIPAETVDEKKYEKGKEDPAYKAAVAEAEAKAKKANELAKIQHIEELAWLEMSANGGLEAYKTAYLKLKYSEVFDDTYNTLVKNWSMTDKPSTEVLNAYKEELKAQVIDAAVQGLEELVGYTYGDTTKWDRSKGTLSKNVIAALKKVITDNTKTIKYTLDSDLGKYFFANVKHDFKIDENAEVSTNVAGLYSTYSDEKIFTGDNDKAIAKYSISQYFVTKTAYRDEEVVRDVSHILFKVDSNGTNGAYTTKEAAKAAAEKLLEEIKASAVDGKVSLEKFIEFASVTHDSSISYTLNKDGQLWGKTTQLLKDYTGWVFAATEEGQLGLVETEYGWHIMYYGGEDISWRKTAHLSSVNEDVNNFTEQLDYIIEFDDSIFDKLFD